MRKLFWLLALVAFAVAVGRAYYLVRTRQPHYIALNWTNPTPGKDNRPERVEIYRGVAPGHEDPSPLAIVPIPSAGNVAPGTGAYSDFAVLPGTTYYYFVVEMNRAGRSPKSSEISATSPADPRWYRRLDTVVVIALCAFLGSLCALPFVRKNPSRQAVKRA
jgi:hypothetical protein